MINARCTYIYLDISIQGGEDAQGDLRCRSLFAKEPLRIGLFYGK